MIKLPFLIRLRAHLEDKKLLRSLDPETTQFRWKTGPRCPQKCVEGNRALIGSYLFITGGYINDIATVSKKIFRLDMKTSRWTDLGQIPAGMPETHNAVISDGQRHIFSVSGQLGAHCSPSVADCFVYDTQTRQWGFLPSLPEPRYMPLIQYYEGRIYCMGGSKPDRNTPARECWSLGIQDGQATENQWRPEFELPAGRTHTPCLIVNKKLYVFGGQAGDVPPINGSAEHLCNFDSPGDSVYDNVFSFDLETQEYSELSPMPLRVSHTETAVHHIGDFVIIAGGTLDRAVTSDLVVCYNLSRDSWKIIGHLPYPMKKTVSAFHDGWFYIATGQCAISKDDLRPGTVVDSVWKARLDFLFESS